MKMNDKNFKITFFISSAAVLLLSALCFGYGIVPGIACLLCGFAVITVYTVYTKRRFNRICSLNNYLAAVCSGNFDLDLPDNSEGELSILKNNLYKIITMLKYQNEALKKDKLYLADSMTDISHQLKTPLTSMMVMTDIIKEEQSAEKRKDFVDIIQSQLEKMRWLIQNLLKLAKLDAGAVEMNKEKLSVLALVEESLKPFLVATDIRDIAISKTGADFFVHGDSGWLCEAVSNIIKNDLEHTPCGGSLSISLSRTALYGLISIKDNGTGIDKEDIKHIFERFYRGKNSSPDSVGIGLALSKTIIEKNLGKIEVESEIGKGTIFKVYLPIFHEHTEEDLG